LPKTYRGKWRGRLHDGDKVVPLILSIGERKATLQIQDQKPELISGLGLVNGMVTGKARGDLRLPATRAAKAEELSLHLQRRGSKLEGEIEAEHQSPTLKIRSISLFGPSFSGLMPASAEQ